MFKKAVKTEAKLRMAISGPAGSGKTYTALEFATGLVSPNGKIAVIDTEHGSASKYSDLYDFDVVELTNFSPNDYIKAIREAERLGYEVLVIDSLTHAWNGKGGVLDIVGGNFSKWKEVNPIERGFIETILNSNIHIIATMRAKMQVEVEKDEKGKAVPKKVGMGAIQRDGIEYEFDVTCMMDVANNLEIEKTRCVPMRGLKENSPTKDFIKPLIEWLHGKKQEPAEPTEAQNALAQLRVILAGNSNKEQSTEEQQANMKTMLVKAFGDGNGKKIVSFLVLATESHKVAELNAGEIIALLQWFGATESNGYTPSADKAELAKQIAG